MGTPARNLEASGLGTSLGELKVRAQGRVSNGMGLTHDGSHLTSCYFHSRLTTHTRTDPLTINAPKSVKA